MKRTGERERMSGFSVCARVLNPAEADVDDDCESEFLTLNNNPEEVALVTISQADDYDDGHTKTPSSSSIWPR